MKRSLSLVLVIMMLLPTLALAEWDGTITVVQSNDLINFDPIASTDTSNKNIIKNCMNRLFETDDMFNPVPILVKEYSVDESGLVWTIKIHDTIKFFNGKTCTVDDVMFCLWRSKNGSSSGKTETDRNGIVYLRHLSVIQVPHMLTKPAFVDRPDLLQQDNRVLA